MDNIDNSLQEIMNNTIDNLRGLVQSEDMIFKPIYLEDGTMAIPLAKVSVGFVSGGGGGQTKEGQPTKSGQLQPYAGGGGGGISMSPMGFLVFYDNQPMLVKVDEKTTSDKWKDLISATINLVKDKK
ncbi:MAG: hypothetical protein HFE34_06015 [Clostridia bacterium]|nr:hypothetical protein [Clostridia bacterium]